jgi:hypothetical protein
MLLQWTGSPFSLESGCPKNSSRINGFRELVLCLHYAQIGALVRSLGIQLEFACKTLPPAFDPLRSNARFKDLRRRIDLPP